MKYVYGGSKTATAYREHNVGVASACAADLKSHVALMGKTAKEYGGRLVGYDEALRNVPDALARGLVRANDVESARAELQASRDAVISEYRKVNADQTTRLKEIANAQFALNASSIEAVRALSNGVSLSAREAQDVAISHESDYAALRAVADSSDNAYTRGLNAALSRYREAVEDNVVGVSRVCMSAVTEAPDRRGDKLFSVFHNLDGFIDSRFEKFGSLSDELVKYVRTGENVHRELI